MSREEIDKLIATGHELSKDQIRRTQEKRRGLFRRHRWSAFTVGGVAIVATFLIVVLALRLDDRAPLSKATDSAATGGSGPAHPDMAPARAGAEEGPSEGSTARRSGDARSAEPPDEATADAASPARSTPARSTPAESSQLRPERRAPAREQPAGDEPFSDTPHADVSGREESELPAESHTTDAETSPATDRWARTAPSPESDFTARRLPPDPERPLIAPVRPAPAESAERQPERHGPEPGSEPSDQKEPAVPAEASAAYSGTTSGSDDPSLTAAADVRADAPLRPSALGDPNEASTAESPSTEQEELKAELRSAFAPPAEDAQTDGPAEPSDSPAPRVASANAPPGEEAETEPPAEPAATAATEVAAAVERNDGEGAPSVSAANRGPRAGLLTPLVLVPAGRAELGAISADRAAMENERPAVSVEVEAFYLEEHEVTNRQYKAFLDDTGYAPVPRSGDPRFSKYDWDTESRTYPEGQADYPVVNVTRQDAAAFAHWAGRRLPTEIEWEYAARHSRPSALYPWGNSLANRLFGNFDGSRLLPTASYPPNDLGLYDLAGNAFEWIGHAYVEDLHERLAASPAVTRDVWLRPARYGLLRGGAYYSTAREIRCSYREFNDPSVRYPGYGFRCAADRR